MGDSIGLLCDDLLGLAWLSVTILSLTDICNFIVLVFIEVAFIGVVLITKPFIEFGRGIEVVSIEVAFIELCDNMLSVAVHWLCIHREFVHL